MTSVTEMSRVGLLGAVLLAVASGCAPAAEELEPSQEAPVPVEEVAERPNPERRGIGSMPMPPPPTGPAAQALTVDPRRSLAVTDQAILNRFTFLAVMNQLAGTSGVPTTPLALFQQWWDTQRPGPGLGLGPNCNSPGIANMNGFPYTCPRAEGNQATVDPFINPTTNPNAYIPIGLFNRFDLASASGADCGEYRVVFAKRSGLTNPLDRNLVIFEAVLPNPNARSGARGLPAGGQLLARPLHGSGRELAGQQAARLLLPGPARLHAHHPHRQPGQPPRQHRPGAHQPVHAARLDAA